MTKMLIDVDDSLLAEAMRMLGTPTKKETVNFALREVVERTRRAQAFDRFRELADSGRYDFEAVMKPWGDEPSAT